MVVPFTEMHDADNRERAAEVADKPSRKEFKGSSTNILSRGKRPFNPEENFWDLREAILHTRVEKIPEPPALLRVHVI